MEEKKEMSQDQKDELIKKELEEAEILEKKLASERRDEVSRMVADLEKENSDREDQENKETEEPDREKKAEEILRRVNQKKQEEEEAKRAAGIEENPAAGSRRRKKGSGKGKKTAAVIAAAAAVILIGGYFAAGLRYRNAFLPGTVINGADVGGKTAEEVKDLIAQGINTYTLTLLERDGKTETITKEEIGLSAGFDGSLEQIIGSQDPNTWLMAMIRGSEYNIEAMISYDSASLAERINSLECMKEENIVPPQDAYVSEYVSGQGYSIVPEVEGTELNPDLVLKKAEEAVQSLRTELSLDEEGCYKEPAVKSDDPQLKERADNLNRYVNVTVTYKFGDKQEVLDGDTIHQWLITDGGNMDISLEGVKGYVQTLATKYNTAYRAKTLKTSYGPEVTITRGNYGWRIDQAAEAEQLIGIIRSGESQEREPVYAQTAASHGPNDYGDTYVEINLTAQHLYFYKEGKLLVESDFVSGNVARGYTTPPGAYPLTYKERNATLRGQGYASPVSYWMPFNGGIGMHDASWRSSFGGTIYKTNGSHGCINLPYAAAKTIYENISKGMPVLCYNLAGTEQRSTTQTAPQTQPQTQPATETQPAQTPPPAETQPPVETQPAVETQPQTQPAPGPGETKAPAGPGDQVGQNPDEQAGPGVGL